MQILAERLKQRRSELKLSQTQVAILAGTTRTQISRYENDENEPSVDVAVALSRVLGVSIHWLVGEDDTPQPAQFSELEATEQQLLNVYRTKTPENQKKLLEIAKML